MVDFSKYKFNNKLLGGIKVFRITTGVTCTHPYISYFDVNFEKSTVRLHYLRIFSCLQNFKVIKYQFYCHY